MSEAELILPDGTTQALVLDPEAPELAVGNTGRQGIYRLRWGTNRVEFAVNLLNGAETHTEPREALDLGRFGTVDAVTLRRASVEIWRWIALGALAVLLFEWWFYHRRTA